MVSLLNSWISRLCRWLAPKGSCRRHIERYWLTHHCQGRLRQSSRLHVGASHDPLYSWGIITTNYLINWIITELLSNITFPNIQITTSGLMRYTVQRQCSSTFKTYSCLTGTRPLFIEARNLYFTTEWCLQCKVNEISSEIKLNTSQGCPNLRHRQNLTFAITTPKSFSRLPSNFVSGFVYVPWLVC